MDNNNNVTTEQVTEAAEERKLKTPESKLRAIKKFQQTGLYKVRMDLSKYADADIIAFLGIVPSKRGLIVQLLMDHMERCGFKVPETEEEYEAEIAEYEAWCRENNFTTKKERAKKESEK